MWVFPGKTDAMAYAVPLKDTEGWDLILPTCLTNGGVGYFPTIDAFEGSGYERSASRFLPGAAELLIEGGKQLLHEL